MKRTLSLLALIIAVALPTYGQSKPEAGEKSHRQPPTGQGSTPEMIDLHLFAGTWKEDLSKTRWVPFSDDALIYERAEDGSTVETREGANPMRTTFRADGRERPVEGWAGLTRTWTRLGPETLESVSKRGGQVTAVTRRVISEGGQTLTVTRTFKDGQSEATWTEVYRRASGSPGELFGRWKLKSYKTDTPDIFELSVTAGGELKHAGRGTGEAYTARLDGKDYPLTGPSIHPDYTVSLRPVGARSFEVTDKRSNQPVRVFTITASPDGKTLAVYYRNPKTKDEPSVFVYERQSTAGPAVQKSDRPQSRASGENSHVEQEILRLEEEMNQAFLQGPERVAAAFERLLAPDYRAVDYLNPAGEPTDKAKTIAAQKESKRTYLTRRLEDVKVYTYGDTAIVTGRFTGRARQSVRGEKEEADRSAVFTSTWVKRGGRWQLVFRQAATIP
jgi:ketosteroid isomerase-like protein